MLSSTRAKSLVGVAIAAAALVGIGVPALEDDSQAPGDIVHFCVRDGA